VIRAEQSPALRLVRPVDLVGAEEPWLCARQRMAGGECLRALRGGGLLGRVGLRGRGVSRRRVTARPYSGQAQTDRLHRATCNPMLAMKVGC